MTKRGGLTRDRLFCSGWIPIGATKDYLPVVRKAVDKLRTEMAVYRLAIQDERTPRAARWMLGLAVGYLLLPFDIIPDFIPGLGQLDDVVIVGLLVRGALRRIPPEVMAECRARVAVTVPRSESSR